MQIFSGSELIANRHISEDAPLLGISLHVFDSNTHLAGFVPSVSTKEHFLSTDKLCLQLYKYQ